MNSLYAANSRLDIDHDFFPIFQKQKAFIIWKEKKMLYFVETEPMQGK